MPDGFESSRTNIASDQGVGKERRSIEITEGRSPYPSRRSISSPGSYLGDSAISLKPSLGIGRSEIKGLDLVRRRLDGPLPDRAHMPGGYSVDGVIRRGNRGAGGLQLCGE